MWQGGRKEEGQKEGKKKEREGGRIFKATDAL